MLQENHYYPFGMAMQGPWLAGSNRYQFGGKELVEDFGLNWQDYGARWYDPAIGRWNAVDPLADALPNVSPYDFVLSNPLRLIDPDGRTPQATYVNAHDGYGAVGQTASRSVAESYLQANKPDDIIDVDQSTGVISITQAAGDDVVRLTDNGEIIDEYVYGENGSFSKDNKFTEQSLGLPFFSLTATTLQSTNPDKAQEFYEFAAQSDVEFGKLDVEKNGVKLSLVTTSHNDEVLYNLPVLVKLYSKLGYTGIKQSHSHPGGPSIPSGYYSYQKGNPFSLMPVPVGSSDDIGDAPNARLARKYPGFNNTIFEVFNPKAKTITTYDGVNQAQIRKAN